MGEAQPLRLDVDGYDNVTQALRDLFDSYPGLAKGETFGFSEIPECGGKSVFTDTGATIYTESESITGHITQMCQYPLTVVFRTAGLSENKKAAAKEWLDNFGRWLERQEVIIDGEAYKLKDYPPLAGNRKIKSISRQTPAFLSQVNDDKTEDWVMSINARYRNEFDTF